MHGQENEKCITLLSVLFCICNVIQISLSLPSKKSRYAFGKFYSFRRQVCIGTGSSYEKHCAIYFVSLSAFAQKLSEAL